jgi:hypothetical protein
MQRNAKPHRRPVKHTIAPDHEAQLHAESERTSTTKKRRRPLDPQASIIVREAPPAEPAAPRAWTGIRALAPTVVMVGAGNAARGSDTGVLLAALAFLAIVAIVAVLGRR